MAHPSLSKMLGTGSDIIIYDPPGVSVIGLALAASGSGSLGVADAEFLDTGQFSALVGQMEASGVRFGARVDPTGEGLMALVSQGVPKGLKLLIVPPKDSLPDMVRTGIYDTARSMGLVTFQEVCSVEEAIAAVRCRSDGIVVRGREGGGRTSELPTIELLSKVLALSNAIPVIARGGIGPQDVRKVVEMGGSGCVLDSQLLTMAESQLPQPMQERFRDRKGLVRATVMEDLGKATRIIADEGSLKVLRELDAELRTQNVSDRERYKALRSFISEKVIGFLNGGQVLYPAGEDLDLSSQFEAYGGLKEALEDISGPTEKVKGVMSEAVGHSGSDGRTTDTVKFTMVDGRPVPPDYHDRSVAIVGVGTVFPKGIGKDHYWNMIMNKVDACTEIPKERWDWRKYYDPDPTKVDKTYTKLGAFVSDLKFDPFEFKLMPKMASQIDLFQRYGLIAAKEALKDAGLLDRKDLDRSRVGTVVANSGGGDNRESVAIRIGFPEIYDYFDSTEAVKKVPRETWDQIKSEAWKVMDDRVIKLCEDSMPGALANVLAGRIANVFNFTGPNFITDAACASALAAIHTARNSLLLDQVDVAISGGSDSGMAAQGFVEFCKIGALTPDGSRPFDTGANGFLMGEGCGIIVLKRLCDAVRDKDRIYAVIKGVGASSDGKGKGITAPNPAGQKLAMASAMKDARIDRSTLSFIEAHGTSTAVGDYAELSSMQEVFKGLPKRSLGLTSVKSQIGHLKSAAGAAGIIKAALSIYNRVIPPQINLKEPNRYFDWDSSPFYVVTEAQNWVRKAPDVPRRCSVSSFGFGGTNFNMVLEEFDASIYDAYLKAKAENMNKKATEASGNGAVIDLKAPDGPKGPVLDMEGWNAYLSKNKEKEAEAFLFSSDNPLDLMSQAEAAAKRAKELTSAGGRLRDAWTEPSPGGRYRLGISVRDADHFMEQVNTLKKVGMNEKALMALMNKGIFVGDRTRFDPGKVCFMFPGQGSQYINMFRDLKEKYSIVQNTFDRADRVMSDLIPRPLSSFVYQDVEQGTPEYDKASDTLRQTEYNQPSMLTVDTAMYELLVRLGVRPDVVMGHSLGEYGALIASGIMDFDDALRAVSARGREMRDLKIDDQGKMASIMAGLDIVEPVLKEVNGYVIAANKNCYVQTVIAGASPAVEEAVKKFQQRGIEAQMLPVSHAFHSAIVAPAKDILRSYLSKLTIDRPKIPILSNVTADSYPLEGDPAAIKEQVLDLLKEQMASSVEWIGQVKRAYGMGCRTYIEVGPKKALTSFAYNILEEEVKKGKVFPITSNHPKKGGVLTFNEMVANLWAIGFDLKFPSHDDPTFYSREFLEARSRFETEPLPKPQPVTEADLSGLGTTNPSRKGARVLISGVAFGLPGRFKDVFSENDLGLLMEGRNLIEPMDPSLQERFVDKNIVRLEKRPDGSAEMVMLDDRSKVAKLAGMLGRFDLVKDFGVPVEVADDLDITTKLVFAAGLLALKDAGIPLVKRYAQTSTGSFLPEEWELPLELQEDTGIIFASAFPGYDQLIKELDLYYRSKFGERKDRYVLPRHFMFRILAMGHSQFAQYIRCKGPNTQMNSACASSTEAIGIAQDWIQTGRCKRVLVLGADVPTSQRGMEWFGSSLLALGALTTESRVEQAAIPFDRRRKGMIMGAGALALVLEAEEEPARRGMNPIAEVLGSHFGNSAFHGARLDVAHIARSMERFITRMEREHGLDREALASDLLFMSHETYTPARGGSSAAEVESLRRTFGEAFRQILVLNTKGYTGHLFGACVEDPILVRCLEKGLAIPIANLDPANTDPQFEGMQLSRGGTHTRNYGLRLAAGFGSQLSFLLVKRYPAKDRFASEERYRQWLSSVATTEPVDLEVVKNVLRLRDHGLNSLIPHRAVKRGSSEIGFERRTLVNVKEEVIEAYREQVVRVFSERSGLPVDLVDIDADLESDMGIDSVKQVELFGNIRVHFDLPKDEGVNLRDYPTLRHVINYVVDKAEKQKETATRKTAPLTGPTVMAQDVRKAPVTTAGPALGWDRLKESVLAIVSERTGYPIDMLDIDLDLEADLGIDTVKQVELFASARTAFDLPRDDTVNLKDFPTLRHIIDYLAKRSGAVAAVPKEEAPPAPVSPPALPSEPAPAAVREGPVAAVPSGPTWDDIRKKVISIVSEKTGYPTDMLELDLDLEADLGIDTVKQVELFASARTLFDLPRDDTVNLKDFPTLRHIIDYLAKRSGAVAAAPKVTGAPPAPVSPPARPSEPAPAAAREGPVAAVQSGPTWDDIRNKVISVVSEKTGYPTDMLELDLDLEADLGIDTVKQVELFASARTLFDLPRDDTVNLKDFPTLRHIIDYLAKRSGAVAAAPKEEAPPAPVSPPARPSEPAPAAVREGPVAAVPSGPTWDDIRKKVVSIVSEKTGYPTDMLELDLDLEADLGIDTVKQVELFASARTLFDLPRDDTVNLKDFPTLRKIVDYLHGRMGGGRVSTPAPELAPSRPEPEPAKAEEPPAKVYTLEELKARINRWVLGTEELPSQPHPVRPPLDGRKALVIGGGDEGARAVLDILGCEGLQAEPEELLKEDLVLDEVEGVINLYPLSLPADPLPGDWKALNEKAVKSLFLTGKALDKKLKGNGFFISVTCMGGNFGLDRDVCPVNGGVAGFTKALGKEYPTSRVFVLDVPQGTAPQTAVMQLARELGSDERLLEVGWDGDRRWRPVLRIVEPPSPKVLDLKPGMKLLVTGGGGGITAEIVKRLATMQRLELHLVDMTPYDDGTKMLAAMSEEELKRHKDKVKQELIDSGKKLSPVILERESLRIDRAIGVVRVLEAIGKSGSKAVYHQADVTDMERMKAIADGHGPFDAVLHCAGVDISKMMAGKPLSDFNKVYDTKVNGAYALLSATRDHPLKLFMTFTSVSGRFGNAAQVDYSAANDLLDKIGGAVRKLHPDCLVKAVGWSAWAQVGMASRGSIKTLLELGGIAFIPVEEGIGYAISEMTSGTEREVFYAGTLGPMDTGGQLKWEEGVHTSMVAVPHANRPTQAASSKGPYPLIGSVVSLSASKVHVRKVLRGDRELFLRDHSIMGTMVMPGVMGMELLAETARLLAPELDVIGLKDMTFSKPVNVEGQLEVSVEGELVDKDGPVKAVSLRVSSLGKDRKGNDVTIEHYTGTVLLGRSQDVCRAVQGHPLSPSSVGSQVVKAEIYRHFFHGPRFQVTSAVEVLNDDELLGVYDVPEQDQFDPSAGWTSDDLMLSPLQTELGFQTAGLHCLDRFGMMALPVRVGRLEVFSKMSPGERALAHVRFRERKENTFSFDVEIMDLSGNVRFSYTDYQLKGLMPFSDRIVKEHAVQFSELPCTVRGIRVFRSDLPAGTLDLAGLLVHFSDKEPSPKGEKMTDKRLKEHIWGILAAKLAVSWSFATEKGRPLPLKEVAVLEMPNGKPYALVSGERVEISISHSGGTAVASVGKAPHGLDLETDAVKDLSFADEAFTDQERALIAKTSSDLGLDREQVMTVLFTAKEAYLKRDGKGMSVNLRTVECSEVVSHPSKEGHLLEIILNDGEKEARTTSRVQGGHVMSICR